MLTSEVTLERDTMPRERSQAATHCPHAYTRGSKPNIRYSKSIHTTAHPVSAARAHTLRVPVRTWARAAGVAPASVAPRPRARPPRWPRPPLPRAPRRPPGAASGGAASSSSSSSSELLSDAAKELASSWSARSWSSWSSSSLELTTTAVAASPAWRRGRAADGAAAGTCVQLSVD